MTARYGPTDSVGSKATGSEKNRLRAAALSAPCEAARCCSTSSSNERSLSRSSSGTYACTSPARYRALSCARCSRDSETRETAASKVFMILHVMPGMPSASRAGWLIAECDALPISSKGEVAGSIYSTYHSHVHHLRSLDSERTRRHS